MYMLNMSWIQPAHCVNAVTQVIISAICEGSQMNIPKRSKQVLWHLLLHVDPSFSEASKHLRYNMQYFCNGLVKRCVLLKNVHIASRKFISEVYFSFLIKEFWSKLSKNPGKTTLWLLELVCLWRQYERVLSKTHQELCMQNEEKYNKSSNKKLLSTWTEMRERWGPNFTI